MTYDLAIIGGGPAAVAAGVYAARKRLKTIFIAKEFGGQSAVSTEIQNWIGTVSLSGADLAANLKKHLLAYAADSVEVKEGALVEHVEKTSAGFAVKTSAETYETRTVLITSGSARRKLAVPGADQYENRGIVYCASCDGPLFANMDVAVVGGGNAAFDTAANLLAYCKSVVLLHRSEEFKADPVTVKTVLANPKMHAILNAEILEVTGRQFVTDIVYREKDTDKKVELPVQGIFVEIGSVPSTDYAKNLIERDRFNQVVVDPRNQRTSTEGVWAAGDCTNGFYHQNNIAVGDAVKALEDIYLYLRAK